MNIESEFITLPDDKDLLHTTIQEFNKNFPYVIDLYPDMPGVGSDQLLIQNPHIQKYKSIYCIRLVSSSSQLKDALTNIFGEGEYVPQALKINKDGNQATTAPRYRWEVKKL